MTILPPGFEMKRVGPAPLPAVVQAGHTPPHRAHRDDAGLDLYAIESAWIEPGRVTTVALGVKVAIPAGHVGLLCLRSSAGRQGLVIPNGLGVIDAGYRGELQLLLSVLDDEAYRVMAGDKVAQLVVVPCVFPAVELVDRLDDTDRGTGGFGSTGR